MDFAKFLSDLAVATNWSVVIQGDLERIADLSVLPANQTPGNEGCDECPCIDQERLTMGQLAEAFNLDLAWLSVQFDLVHVAEPYQATRLAEALQAVSNCLNKHISAWRQERGLAVVPYGNFTPPPDEQPARVEEFLQNIIRRTAHASTPFEALEVLSSYHMMWSDLITLCRIRMAKECVQELEFNLCGLLHFSVERHGREAVVHELETLLGRRKTQSRIFVLCAKNGSERVEYISHNVTAALGRRLPRHVYDVLDDFVANRTPRYSSLPNL